VSDPVISVSGLSKAYNLYERPRDVILEAVFGGVRHDVFWALRDVSFDIHEGERVGFVGPNGAGKSTLLKIITGNLQPTGGTVRVDGRVSALLSLNSFLDPEQTGLENIRFNLVMNGVPKRQIPSLTEEIVDFTELGAFVHAPVRTYSSGMSARLSFAISTAITPDILVVDEVLGAGDAYFAAKATVRMIELCNQGRALLFVSHAASAVQMLCNRAIWLDGGAVRASGEVNEIVRAYEADFRRAEDESLRVGNQVATAQASHALTPGLVDGGVVRLRLTGPSGRITDTHYVRSLDLVVDGQPLPVSLDLRTLDDGVAAALDLLESEWGRRYERKGVPTRALGPSSRPLRGGHVLVRPASSPVDLEVVVVATSISDHEPLLVEWADGESAGWLALPLQARERLAGGWERARFAGRVAVPAGDDAAWLERIVEQSRPDVEILGVELHAAGENVLSVRERQPFEIVVTVEAHRPVERADVWLKLVRSDGVYVFWQSSGQVGEELRHQTGTHEVVFHVEPNLFGAGDYEISVDVANGFDVELNWPASQVYDRRVNALKFTVAREAQLLMLGPVNYRFPVSIRETVRR
jgi:lipopolysaccharide transport system ATP-binding protein